MYLKRLSAAVVASVLCAVMATSARATAPLADAAERMDRASVRHLIEQGADINQAQVDGMTALHWAVYNDDAETAALLLDAAADAAAANRYGVRPLSLACANGNAAIVERLLAAGADPNTALRGGETALMTAARTGKLAPVELLIARGADVDAAERKGQTAIMWAAADGHAEVVQALVDAGADFRTPLRSGFTPLCFAARDGHAEVVRILLAAGADANEAMRPAASAGRAPEKGTAPLILAVENGHFEIAIALLEAGADPNDQRSGFTALHVISWVRKPNRGDGEDGDPAPMGSGAMTSIEFVREIVARGAEVNLRLAKHSPGRGLLNKSGATPFFLASMTADAPLMQALLELGADPSIPNRDGCTPLMAAAGVGNRAPGEEAGTEAEVLEALDLLLELGADINAVDDNGETAMHGAAYKHLPLVAPFLAEHGARIEVWNRPNKFGWTPLAIAEGYRQGNFKPSPETLAALHEVMLAEGITPPNTSGAASFDIYSKRVPKRDR